jgi:uncharacterized protein
MVTIFIDADACAVTRQAISVARRFRAPVVLVANESQNMDRWVEHERVSVVRVSKGRDAADFAMVPMLTSGDVVVTDDTGLAAMALARGARAITSRGRLFSAATIDAQLEVRHAEQKHRRSGGRTRGPAPLEDVDRDSFVDSLRRLLEHGDS